MTLINAWTHGKVGYLMTDTAIIDFADGGKAIGFGSKIFHGANWPAIVAVSYAGGLMQFAIPTFVENEPKNLKSLVKLLPLACKNATAKAREHGSPNPFYSLVVVAWCARTKRPRIFTCANHDYLAKAYAVRELNYFFGNGIASPAVLAAAEKLDEGKPLDLDRDLVDLCEAQRAEPFVGFDNRPTGFGAIGGQVQLATITKRNVEFSLVHEWPDKMGLPLGLAA